MNKDVWFTFQSSSKFIQLSLYCKKIENVIISVKHFCLDGGWSSWSAVSWAPNCSTTCGLGIQYGQRTRTCTNPSPENGGKPCSGPSTITVTRACKIKVCPPGNQLMH